MLTIGLCGGSGTGKNLVEAMLQRLGIPGLDTDLVYHRLIGAPSPLTRELSHRFGNGILTAEGAVDRPRLREIVFSDGAEGERALADLNRMTHAAVLTECRAWLEEQRQQGAVAALINAPLLFESGFHTECDLSVGVVAEEAVRLDRLVNRDGLSTEEAKRRLSHQCSEAFLRESCDIILENNGTEDELFAKVRALYEHINNLAKEQTDGTV
ncbi:MAG: dephospho-CoA kinase [Clostridia bacterium]|nr:dephospho-CoA kinase [Clostridia bacterium]